MSQSAKLLLKLLRGNADGNFSFDELRNLLIRLGSDERIKASHHIFTRGGIEEIINLQPKRGQAKPYQVKQVRELIVKYKLDTQEDESDEGNAEI
jgi:hypothetical protein